MHRLGGFWGFLGVKNRGNEKRAIATKAIQVCFSLLLEFLPMFDFSACLFLNVGCIVDFVWTKRATNCFVDIGCLFIFVPNLFVIFPISLNPLKNHEMWLYLISFIIMSVCSLLVFYGFPLYMFWIIPLSFLVTVCKRFIWVEILGG